ncbi:hypothetical protein KIW84_040156 [Lathyrus oleraceus]|uniref:Major facilitator superfamily (MFS) profile domain-containing protein n=1 Tax=Pisum sativum TaxID=3888 RepID=A0A9D4X7V6_PEA|nr:hypothetical protein KIW84_040156 [Pisum sativum]
MGKSKVSGLNRARQNERIPRKVVENAQARPKSFVPLISAPRGTWIKPQGKQETPQGVVVSIGGLAINYRPTFGVGAVQVLATILTLWLADKSGRRLLLIVSSSAMALSLLVVSISFYLKILPINIKGLAGSFATLANWFFSWLVTLTTNLLLDWSSGGTFTIYTAVCVFTAGFVAIWVPETKGKTLEEIQQFFR